MERINGYQVFIKEEMNNDNAKTVISEMIQRNVDDLENWKPESGMAKLWFRLRTFQQQDRYCIRLFPFRKKQYPDAKKNDTNIKWFSCQPIC